MKERFKSYSFFIIFLIILTVSFIYPSFSQAINLDLVGYIGGKFNDFQVVGNYAYFATDEGLKIIDISNPSALVEVGIYNISEPIYDVVIDNSKIYASANRKILIIDISNPASPFNLSTYNTTYEINDLYVLGGIAYTSFKNFGIRVIDFETGSAPKTIASYKTDRDFEKLYISGNYLYEPASTSNSNIIKIYDISNPSAINFNQSSYTYARNIAGSQSALKQNILFSDSYVLLNVENNFDLIDFSSLTEPQFINHFNFNKVENTFFDRTKIYILTGSSLKVIDIADSSFNANYTSINLSGKIVVSVNTVYLLSNFSFSVFTLQDSDTAIEINNYLFSFPAEKIDIFDNIAYLKKGSLLMMLDLADAKTPQLIGSYQIAYNDIFVSAGKAYLLTNTGLSIVDVSDPSASFLLGEYADNAYGHIFVSGNIVFAAGNSNLAVLDTTDPSNITLLDKIDLNNIGSVNGISFNGVGVFLNTDKGLKIFNIKKYFPDISVNFDTNSDYSNNGNIYVIGTNCHLLRNSHFEIYTVQNTEFPSMTFSFKLPDNTNGFYVKDNKVLFNIDNKKIMVFDLSGLPQTYLVAFYRFDSPINSICLNGSYIYAVGNSSDMTILHVREQKNCSYDLSYFKFSISNNDQEFPINISTANGCGWKIKSDVKWIQIKEISDEKVTVYVKGNYYSSDRTGTVSIGNKLVKIDQWGTCSLSISESISNFPSSSDNGSISVFAPEGCSWTAQSSNEWVSIITGTSGTGDGTINFSVSRNKTSKERKGKINVSGKILTIKQFAGINGYSLKKFGGKIKDLKVYGNYLYFIDTSNLTILDIAHNQSSPQFVSSIGIPETAEKLFIRDSAAFITAGESGLIIIDISNPTSPRIITNYVLSANIRDVYVSDNMAFLNSSGLITALNITDLYHPKLLFNRRVNNGGLNFFEGNNKIFFTGNGFDPYHSALQIFSINNYSLLDDMGPYENFTGNFVYGLASGNHAIVLNERGGLKIIDVTDPLYPFTISSFADFLSEKIIRYGDYLYAINKDKGFGIIDISDVQSPSLAGTLDWNHELSAVGIKDKTAYIADNDNSSILSIDVGNKEEPSISGSYLSIRKAQAIIAFDSRAYVSSRTDRLRVINYQDPKKPQINNFLDTNVENFFIYGNILYAINNSNIKIFDISRPDNPIYAGKSSTKGFKIKALFIKNNFRYEIIKFRDNYYLTIEDITNPLKPEFKGFYSFFSTGTNPSDVYVKRNIAYVTNGGKGLYLINVKHPKKPRKITKVKSYYSNLKGIYISDRKAYIASGRNGVLVFDISKPKKAKLINSYKTSKYPKDVDVYVEGNTIYVARYDKGVSMIKIKNAGADLIGRWVSMDRKSNSINGSLLISNIGDRTSKNTIISIYITDSLYLSKKDIPVKKIRMRRISPNKQRNKTFSFRTRKSPKHKFITAVIDKEGRIRETNKDNNIVVSPPIK